jgi:hypothetical protein
MTNGSHNKAPLLSSSHVLPPPTLRGKGPREGREERRKEGTARSEIDPCASSLCTATGCCNSLCDHLARWSLVLPTRLGSFQFAALGVLRCLSSSSSSSSSQGVVAVFTADTSERQQAAGHTGCRDIIHRSFSASANQKADNDTATTRRTPAFTMLADSCVGRKQSYTQADLPKQPQQ